MFLILAVIIGSLLITQITMRRSHYRPKVGKQILEIIYSQDAKSKIDQLTQN